MPTSPKTICPRCGKATKGRCGCTPKVRDYDAQRGSSAERGYNGAWQKARIGYLKSHPLCVECEKDGRLEAATVVDHIEPHRGDKEKFWDYENWQSLCKRCHDKKTRMGK